MLKLSKKGDYALKAICYIASDGNLVQIKEISEDQDISESMLRQIIAELEKANLLKTVQGRYGGVKLAMTPDQISVFDVLLAVKEELGITNCTKGIHCSKLDTCYTTNVFNKLQKGFNSLLKMHTLDKIIQK